MSTPNNGGPAFPQAADSIVTTGRGHERASGWTGAPDPGMTLRDYFAAKALPAVLAAMSIPSVDKFLRKEWGDDADAGELAAKAAYRLSDAMLATRKDKP